MNKISLTAYVLVAIMVIAVFFGVYSFDLSNIKARAVPIAACALIFILTAIELIREFRTSVAPKKESIQTSQAMAADVSGETKRLYALFGWMFGFFVAIYLFGFPISIFLFVFLFLKLHGRGWVASISSAVVTAGVIYLLFVVILKISLFQGIVFEGFSIEHWIESGRKSL